MSNRKTYDKEFKKQAVQLSNQEGTTTAQVARDLGIEPELLYKWRAATKKKGAAAFPGKGNVPADEEQVRQLQQELARVQMERDILKKALSVFARQ